MKSARDTLPEKPANGLTGGIDWARDDHAVSVVDDRGRQILRLTVEHSAAGLRQRRDRLGRPNNRRSRPHENDDAEDHRRKPDQSRRHPQAFALGPERPVVMSTVFHSACTAGEVRPNGVRRKKTWMRHDCAP